MLPSQTYGIGVCVLRVQKGNRNTRQSKQLLFAHPDAPFSLGQLAVCSLEPGGPRLGGHFGINGKGKMGNGTRAKCTTTINLKTRGLRERSKLAGLHGE